MARDVEHPMEELDPALFAPFRKGARRRKVLKFLSTPRRWRHRRRILRLLDELDEKYGRSTLEEKAAIAADLEQIFGRK